MITTNDSYNTIDLGKYYAILPTQNSERINYYRENFDFKRVAEGFSYASGSNSEFLSTDEIRSLIETEILTSGDDLGS